METRSTDGTRAIESRRPEGSPGLHGVLDVLEALSNGDAMTLAELARALQLPKSTLHRVCSALVERSWVVRGRDDGRYRLGLRAMALAAGAVADDTPLTAAFRPVGERLRDRHDETVCLAVLDAADSIFVAKVETTQAVRLVTSVGSRLPAFAAASGRVMLADLPEDALEARFAGRPLVTPTGRSLGGLDGLRALLADVRRDGYAENVGDTARGLHCLAAPITNGRGRVLAAMTFCVPIGRIDARRRRALLGDLRAAAATVSVEVASLPTPDARVASYMQAPLRRGHG